MKMPFHEQQLYFLQQKYNDRIAMDIKEEKIKESREREREMKEMAITQEGMWKREDILG